MTTPTPKLRILPFALVAVSLSFVLTSGSNVGAQADAAAGGEASTEAAAAAASSTAGEIDGLEIAKRWDKASRADTEHQIMTMTLMNKRGQTRVRTIEGWSREISADEEHRFSLFKAPSDVKDTTLLSYDYDQADDDTWLYLPALKKVKRILSSNKTDYFMGSDFTYEDMENIDLKNWKYTVIGEETVAGVDCWKLQAEPATDEEKEETGYSKSVSWIGKDDYIARQAEYTDKKQRLAKRLTVEDIRLVAGKRPRLRGHKVTMENLITGHKTVLDIQELQLDIEIADKIFSQRNLKQ